MRILPYCNNDDDDNDDSDDYKDKVDNTFI